VTVGASATEVESGSRRDHEPGAVIAPGPPNAAALGPVVFPPGPHARQPDPPSGYIGTTSRGWTMDLHRSPLGRNARGPAVATPGRSPVGAFHGSPRLAVSRPRRPHVSEHPPGTPSRADSNGQLGGRSLPVRRDRRAPHPPEVVDMKQPGRGTSPSNRRDDLVIPFVALPSTAAPAVGVPAARAAATPGAGWAGRSPVPPARPDGPPEKDSGRVGVVVGQLPGARLAAHPNMVR
jgi:hypothetical protein